VLSLWNEAWPGSLKVEFAGGSQVHEAKILRLDSSKARELLGWRPTLSLPEAMELTAQWYQRWVESQSGMSHSQRALRACTEAQISAFSSWARERRNEAPGQTTSASAEPSQTMSHSTSPGLF
jgi:CDP-glucose 4,6-dehydratase